MNLKYFLVTLILTLFLISSVSAVTITKISTNLSEDGNYGIGTDLNIYVDFNTEVVFYSAPTDLNIGLNLASDVNDVGTYGSYINVPYFDGNESTRLTFNYIIKEKNSSIGYDLNIFQLTGIPAVYERNNPNFDFNAEWNLAAHSLDGNIGKEIRIDGVKPSIAFADTNNIDIFYGINQDVNINITEIAELVYPFQSGIARLDVNFHDINGSNVWVEAEMIDANNYSINTGDWTTATVSHDFQDVNLQIRLTDNAENQSDVFELPKPIILYDMNIPTGLGGSSTNFQLIENFNELQDLNFEKVGLGMLTVKDVNLLDPEDVASLQMVGNALDINADNTELVNPFIDLNISLVNILADLNAEVTIYNLPFDTAPRIVHIKDGVAERYSVQDANILENYLWTADGNFTFTAQGFSMYEFDGNAPEFTITTPEINDLSAIININANENVQCKYDSNSDLNYFEMTSAIYPSSTTFSDNFNITISNLNHNTDYNFYFICEDVAGNVSTQVDNNASFTTTTTPIVIIRRRTSTTPPTTTPPEDTLGATVVNILNETQDINYNAQRLGETLGNMTNDKGMSLFSQGKISEMAENTKNYRFRINTIVDEMTDEQGNKSYTTTISTTITNNSGKDQRNVRVVIEVPKTISDTAEKIRSGTIFTVLRDNPILEFTVPLLSTGQTQTITYEITDEEEPSIEDTTFNDPIVSFSEEVVSDEDPTVCPTVWIPVCGVDGETYSNDCYANAAGIAIAYEGECEITPTDPIKEAMDYTMIIIVIIVLLAIVGIAYYKREDIQKAIKK